MELQERLERSEAFLKEITEKLTPKQSAIACSSYSENAETPAATKYDIEYLSQRINWLKEDLGYFQQAFLKHMEGHLPKIVGAKNMEKALKAIGLDGDFEVQKQVIYANDGKATAEQFLINKKL